MWRVSLQTIRWSVGVLLVVWGCSGCKLRHDRQSELPSGWSLGSGAQILARSYPTFTWMSLILPPQEHPQKLLGFPSASLMRWGQQPVEQRPGFLPRMPWEREKKAKDPRMLGLILPLRSNRSLWLECRFQAASRKGGERVTFAQRFWFERSPRIWKKKRLAWADFQPLESLPSVDSLPSSQPTSQKASSQPTSQKASQPSTQKNAVDSMPSSQPSTQKAVSRRLRFSWRSLGREIAIWEVGLGRREHSVTLMVGKPQGWYPKKRKRRR